MSEVVCVKCSSDNCQSWQTGTVLCPEPSAARRAPSALVYKEGGTRARAVGIQYLCLRALKPLSQPTTQLRRYQIPGEPAPLHRRRWLAASTTGDWAVGSPKPHPRVVSMHVFYFFLPKIDSRTKRTTASSFSFTASMSAAERTPLNTSARGCGSGLTLYIPLRGFNSLRGFVAWG